MDKQLELLEERLAAVERAILRLSKSVSRIESQLGIKPDAKILPQSPEPPNVVPVAPMPVEPPPADVHAETTPVEVSSRSAWLDLEAISGKWALWAGVLLTLLALAFGIAYGWRYVGPWGRVVVGMMMGTILLFGGEYARRRAAQWVSEGLSGGGLALLYVTFWAMHMKYQLVGIAPSFVLMALVTAAGIVLSTRRNALSLCILTGLGGYLVPVLLNQDGGSSQYIFFLSYLALLNSGVLVASFLRRWGWLSMIALACSTLLFWGWVDQVCVFHVAFYWEAFIFACLYFCLFAGSAFIRGWKGTLNSVEASLAASSSAVLALTVIFFFHWLDATANGVFLVVLGVACLGAGVVSLRHRPGVEILAWAWLVPGLAWLLLAVPFLCSKSEIWWPVPVSWAAASVLLCPAGQRFSITVLRIISPWVWGFSALASLVSGAYYYESEALKISPIFNWGFAGLAASIAAGAFLAWRSAGHEEKSADFLAVFTFLLASYAAYSEPSHIFYHLHWYYWKSAAYLCTAVGWGILAGICFSRTTSEPVKTTALLVWTAASVLTIWKGTISVHSLWIPFFNLRTLAYASVCTSGAVIAFLAKEKAELRNTLSIVSYIIGLYWASAETFAAFERWSFFGPTMWRDALNVCISFLWVASAVIALVFGMVRRYPPLRILAIVIFGMVVTKALLWDLGFLPIVPRVFMFGVLGACLIWVGWLYGRREKK